MILAQVVPEILRKNYRGRGQNAPPYWLGLKDHGFHGDKATILYLTLKYYSLSVLSEKLYFLEIGPVNQKLWPFKCMMLKTLNSNFLTWENTLSQTLS